MKRVGGGETWYRPGDFQDLTRYNASEVSWEDGHQPEEEGFRTRKRRIGLREVR